MCEHEVGYLRYSQDGEKLQKNICAEERWILCMQTDKHTNIMYIIVYDAVYVAVYILCIVLYMHIPYIHCLHFTTHNLPSPPPSFSVGAWDARNKNKLMIFIFLPFIFFLFSFHMGWFF